MIVGCQLTEVSYQYLFNCYRDNVTNVYNIKKDLYGIVFVTKIQDISFRHGNCYRIS